MKIRNTYVWWRKSCTSWDGKYPIIYRVVYIPGGTWFLNHQQYCLLERCVKINKPTWRPNLPIFPKKNPPLQGDVTGWKIPTMNESMSVFFLVKKLLDFPCHVCFQRVYLEKSSHDLSWPISMVSFRPLSIRSWSRFKWLYHNSLKTNHICKVGDDPHPPTIFLNFTLPNFTHLKPPICQK